MKSSILPAPAPADESDMRQRILHAAFHAFTENGYAGTSTLAIATRAKVSKRDLYGLFENKQAMLVACIKSRTAAMRMPEGLPEPDNRETLASVLTAFATNLLTESTHPAVVAMFRLAISEADRSPEVARALEESREANRHRLADLLVHAQSAGLLPSGDTAEMASQCHALLWEDVMLGLLLGVRARPGRAQIQRHAAKAVTAFLQLHPRPARSGRGVK
jgi:AcrR family transcriptional regulator